MHQINGRFHGCRDPGIVGHTAGIGAGRGLAGLAVAGNGGDLAVRHDYIHQTGIHGVEIERLAALLHHLAGIGRRTDLARRARRGAAFRVAGAPLGLIEDFQGPEMQIVRMAVAVNPVGVWITSLFTQGSGHAGFTEIPAFEIPFLAQVEKTSR